MFHKPVSGLAGIVFLLHCATIVSAQDFRAYTQIFDARVVPAAAQKTAPSRLVGRSTALFHAGRVFDASGAGNQMTIFEPAHSRFVIIDGARLVQTELSFEYIENRLFRAVKNTEKHIVSLQEKDTSEARELASLLQFQLTPAFKESYDDKRRLLTLSSPGLSYEIKSDDRESSEILEAYLNYLDWAARLNYLVNKRALLPGPRLAVHDVLRRRRMLPVEVTLHSSHLNGLHLRAEHRFNWTLDATAQKMIADCEKLMSNGELKKLSPQEFFEPISTAKANDRH